MSAAQAFYYWIGVTFVWVCFLGAALLLSGLYLNWAWGKVRNIWAWRDLTKALADYEAKKRAANIAKNTTAE